jgi:transposase-like protein
MNFTTLQQKFNTHSKCIKHLEKVRWDGHPTCLTCHSDKVYYRKARDAWRKTPQYHCNICNKDFTVLKGTIFEGSKMPLQKWFALISMMLNARKGISAMQISRDLGITYKAAWYSAMRVRCCMLDQASMLEGIVEMDEVYIGGKPRYRYGKLPSELLFCIKP